MPREVLDRVLGSAKNQGNEMAQYVLLISHHSSKNSMAAPE